MPLRFFQVFVCINRGFLFWLSDISIYGDTIACLFILLIKEIWVVSSLEQCLADSWRDHKQRPWDLVVSPTIAKHTPRMVGLESTALNFLSQMLLVYIPKPLTNGVPFHPSLLTFFKHFSDSDLILYLATSSPQSPAVKNLSSLISTIIRFIWVMKTQMLFKTLKESGAV